MVKWGANEPRRRTSASNWNKPLRWNSDARMAGRIDTVFCLSLGDIWDNKVDPEWRDDALDVMRATPNLLYLLLSKRIGNAVDMCNAWNFDEKIPRNTALGATMIDQKEWDRELPKLKRAAHILEPQFTFASVEPMLGEIDTRGEFPGWVICGGESGHDARPMNPVWARSLRDQCVTAKVPFFFKQNGEWVSVSEVEGAGRHFMFPDGATVRRVGKKLAGRTLDHRTWDERP